MDDEASRPRIPPFLEKHGFHGRVLLGDAERLKGYDTQTSGILYAVDRKGMLAGTPHEFEPDMETQAERRVSRLLSSDSSSGHLLFSVEQAPERFEILWKRPLPGELSAVVLASGAKGGAAEVGVLDKTLLRRFSNAGASLGETELGSEATTLSGGYEETTLLGGSDLDGDGNIEWILDEHKHLPFVQFQGPKHWGHLALVDSQGGKYWSYLISEEDFRFVSQQDLDGDGVLELIFRQANSVTARRAIAANLWSTPPLVGLKSVVPNPEGGFLVHEGSRIQALDRWGKLSESAVKAPAGAVLAGRIGRGKSSQDLFTILDGPEVRLLNDFTKQGGTEILVASPGFLSIYSLDGKPRLSLQLNDDTHAPILASGDLDGLPGDEIVLYARGYGLVAFGVAPSVKAGGKEERSRENAGSPARRFGRGR
jgi:hypothetical protein